MSDGFKRDAVATQCSSFQLFGAVPRNASTMVRSSIL